MAAKCNKFLPNIFNKTKCQHCFAAKEAHSAEALENNKASRKVSKCGYLFVSPGFDFNNPLDRSKRWQRRFFVLYDDGELTYSVDENPDTVPQCTVDMNKCTDVADAEKTTTHTNSLSIITPEKTVYIKGNSKEEIQWWHDVLAEFPKALKAIRPRRKQPYLILSNKENLQPDSVDGRNGSEPKQGRFDVEKVKSRSEGPISSTFRGVRSLKHKYDTNHQEGLRKSSSLHDLSSDGQDLSRDLESSRFLSRSGDRLDIMSRDSTFSIADTKKSSLPTNPYFTIPRSTWTRTGQPIPAAFSPKNNQSHTLSSSHFNSSSSLSSTSSTNSAAVARRGSLGIEDSPSSRSSERGSRAYRERSSSLKEFPTQLSLAKSIGDQAPQHAISTDETDSNETDELKMARSSELSTVGQAYSLTSSSFNPPSSSSQYEDLVYMKKGWLIKHADTEKESRKHWFVLAGNSLRYYKDAKAEEGNIFDGRIDLSSCYEVSEINLHRNYGFKIKTRNGEYVLAAMTSGIRNNWMKAVRLFMEIHNSASHRGVAGSISRAASSAPQRAFDDFEVKSGNATISTAAVKGAGGETAFQLVGRVEPQKREMQRPTRRHYSDVNPGNVSQVLSVKEFSHSLDSSSDPMSSSTGSSKGTYSHKSSGAIDFSRRSPSGDISSRIPTLKRFVEGSEHLPSQSSVPTHSSDYDQSKSPRRSVTSESNKEEVKREMMRRAKSPSARVREKSRASKTSRLHSPITAMDDTYNWSTVASDTGSAVSDEPTYTDIPMSEDEYPPTEDTDHEDIASTGTSDVVGGEDALVEILETEVESLKDRLEHTQTELDKMHKDNIDLKSRLHKESTQSLDSGYSNSSRWSQSSNQPEMLKRQLKEARDTVQRQRLDIESLKSKLDMSVSKLTGTEKALSEALRDYKQEKDKFLKLSTEWNRRIRTLEDSSKESIHKMERSRDSLQSKERECRRLEAEVKNHLQRSREQEREILKLKAVEHEYNQLKEKLDDKEQDLASLRSEMKEKELTCKRMKDDFEKQMDDMEHEFAQERDCLENHLEQLKMDLYNVHDRQASMTDNMTSNIADMLREKDEIVAQLEDKMIEADKKMVEMSEEIHSERGYNSELAHDINVMEEDKLKLVSTIEKLENQLRSIQGKVSGFESENFSLRKQLDDLQKKNARLQSELKNSGKASSSAETAEHNALKKTIEEMNHQIDDLKGKLHLTENAMSKASFDRLSSISSMASDHQEDLLHSVIVIDSHLKEVNSMLLKLRQNFDAYIDSELESPRDEVIKLADLVEDIGQKCQNMQDVLRDPQENILPPLGEEYKHDITVDATSDKKIIISEYKGLKVKFDQVVTELQRVKKGMSLMESPDDIQVKEDARLKEKIEVMEGAFKEQVVELIARVDGLSDRIVNVQFASSRDSSTNPFSNNPDNVMREIEVQLQELNKRLSSLEKQAAASSTASSFSSESGSELLPLEMSALFTKLEDIKSQLEDSGSKLENLSTSFPSYSSAAKEHISQVQQCEARLSALSSSLKASSDLKTSSKSGEASKDDSAIAAEGVSHCLLDIRERIQEVGELLDSIEEDGEDSDSEDEECEQTTVEDVREKLASLVEFIEQHSKLSTSDWAVLRLLTVQKSNLEQSEAKKDVETVTAEDKLKLYSDKLSLEAVILYEMAHILQNKDHLTPEDSVFREMESLNSELLFLHQRLDDETKTMHFDTVQADLLSAYTELLAEKILVNGQLCSSTFDQRSHLSKSNISDTHQSIQPLLLATEALMRSQIDSHISQNLDRSVEEVISLPTHLMTRSIVQGDLTFALQQLKSRLEQSPEVLQAGSAGYQFVFDRLMKRQESLMSSLESYESQMIDSLAVIIWKESEEMTIVDVPESVLDAMCSELSTIMERHIQHHKEKCRSARDMNSARKFDMIVNELRMNRETVLTKIKSHYEAYSKDQTTIRDSSLDVPVQSLDNSISNFGEILSLKAIVKGGTYFLSELLKMGSSVLEELDLDTDSDTDESATGIEKGLTSFVSAISEALQTEAFSKETLSQKLTSNIDDSSLDQSTSSAASENTSNVVLRMPLLTDYPKHMSEKAMLLVREAVFSAQLTFTMFKMKLAHEREMGQVKSRRPLRTTKPQNDTEESRDSEETLDLQPDFEALLMPLEEVLESKHEDEVEVLQVVLNQVSQMKADLSGKNPTSQAVDEHLRQLVQKLHHEIDVAKQRHKTHLEVFKQESGQLEKTLEEQQQDHDHYEERCAQLEEELNIVQINHEEEKECMKQDILTAVHAIKSNDEKSETQLTEKASKLSKELAIQKLNFRKMLGSIKKDVGSKDKNTLGNMIDGYIATISINSEDEEEDYQPPLPDMPPPSLQSGVSVSYDELPTEASESSKALDMSHHEQEVEQLKKEKEEALAEEMRNTKAALDAMRKAYEEELVMEKAKYKEALVTMYTEEYVNEIRLRHQEEEEHVREELQKLNIHYSSKCEDYKLLEMRLGQTKQDLESHIQQLISSNNHLEEMLNREIDSLKDFIKNKPSAASLTTGSATMEEELYDAKIMVRVKDAELQKLRSQVKNLENSLQRTTEEQRHTMTQYMQSLKTSGENKKQYQCEIQQLTERLNKVLGSQGLKANIKRTPSFHQRARSPSPQPSAASPRKDSDHSSRESHRRRHLQPKDLRRSKSSPSLPYVFDGKGVVPKASASSKLSRRSRSPKS